MREFILAGALASALAVSTTVVAQQQSEEAGDPQAEKMAACRVGLVLGPGESCHVPDGARFGVRDDGCVGERLGVLFLSIPLLGDVPVSAGGNSVSYSVGRSETRTTWDKGPDGERTNERTVTCVSGHIEIDGFRATEVQAAGRPSSWRIDALVASGADVDAASEQRTDEVEEAKRRLAKAAARCSARTAPAGLAVAGGVLAPAFDRDQTFYDVWASGDHLDITASATAEVIELRGTGPDGSPLPVAAECAVMGMAAGRNSITVEVEWEDGTRGTYALAAHYAGESMPVEAGDLILPSEDCFRSFHGDGALNLEACYATRNGVGGVLAREVAAASEDAEMRIDESGLVKSASAHLFAAYPELREQGLLGSGTAAEQGKFPVWRDYRPIGKVGPVYPRRALVRRITGWVVAEFCVTASGETRDMKVVDAQPPGIFDEAALEAVRQFRYEPKVILGRPLEVCGVHNRLSFDVD